MGKNKKSRYGIIDRMLRGFIAQDGKLFLTVLGASIIIWALCIGAWILADVQASLNDSWLKNVVTGLCGVFATFAGPFIFLGWTASCSLDQKRIERKIAIIISNYNGSDDDCLAAALRAIAVKIGQSDFSPYFFHQFHQIRRWWWIETGKTLPDYKEFQKEGGR